MRFELSWLCLTCAETEPTLFCHHGHPMQSRLKGSRTGREVPLRPAFVRINLITCIRSKEYTFTSCLQRIYVHCTLGWRIMNIQHQNTVNPLYLVFPYKIIGGHNRLEFRQLYCDINLQFVKCKQKRTTRSKFSCNASWDRWVHYDWMTGFSVSTLWSSHLITPYI